jgi:site-specific DNA-methyltransferase (adenine-specific)
MWVYGSGFPKSLDVGKAIDKAAGAEREKVTATGGSHKNRNLNDDGWSKIALSEPTMSGRLPVTPAALQWNGWGTALKPAHEPIVVARKPLEGTVAENVLKHGTGAINVDACRVEGLAGSGVWGSSNAFCQEGRVFNASPDGTEYRSAQHPAGRWPANFIHDGSGEVLELFPETAASKSTPRHNGEFKSVAKGREYPRVGYGHDDNGGSAARFFYCAKASRGERDAGLEEFDAKRDSDRTNTARRNHHPTVKPITLMRYLVRLITPPAGATLDPFMGSGTTGIAALQEGARFIGIELLKDYFDIAEARLCKVLL